MTVTLDWLGCATFRLQVDDTVIMLDKHLVSQGAVRIDHEVIEDQSTQIANGTVLRVGRRKWYRIVPS